MATFIIVWLLSSILMILLFPPLGLMVFFGGLVLILLFSPFFMAGGLIRDIEKAVRPDGTVGPKVVPTSHAIGPAIMGGILIGAFATYWLDHEPASPHSHPPLTTLSDGPATDLRSK